MGDTAVKNKVLYEIYILLSPEIINTDIFSIEENIQKLLKNHGADIKKTEKFVKVNFSYPINKHQTGYAATLYFEADPLSIKEIIEDLKVSESTIIRSMISRTREMKRTQLKRPEIKIPEIPEFKEVNTPKSQEQKEQTKELEEKQKTTLEDIDKRLDEIMGDF